jgi:hypothetical protein
MDLLTLDLWLAEFVIAPLFPRDDAGQSIGRTTTPVLFKCRWATIRPF